MLTNCFQGQTPQDIVEKLAPFETRKFRSDGKEEARPGGVNNEKRLEKASRKPCSLNLCCFEQHNELGFMFAQFRTQNLQSYSYHSSGT